MLERIDTYPTHLNFQTPPIATAEKFIGQVGCNLALYQGKDDQGRHIYKSTYDVVALLNLRLRDSRVDTIKRIVSNLTYFFEVRCLGDPNFPAAGVKEPIFIVPGEIQNKVNEGLKVLHAQNKQIPVKYSDFTTAFSILLTNEGMEELAARLNPIQDPVKPDVVRCEPSVIKSGV